MRFIFSYLKKYWKIVAIVIIIKFSATLGELMLPYVLEHMIDDVVPIKDIRQILYPISHCRSVL